MLEASASLFFNWSLLRNFSAAEYLLRFRLFSISSISSRYLVCWYRDGRVERAFVAIVSLRRSASWEWPESVDCSISVSLSSRLSCFCSSEQLSIKKFLVRDAGLCFPECALWDRRRGVATTFLALIYYSRSHAALSNSSSSASARFSLVENRWWNLENNLLLSLVSRFRLARSTRERPTMTRTAVVRTKIAIFLFFPSSKKLLTEARRFKLEIGIFSSSAPALWMNLMNIYLSLRKVFVRVTLMPPAITFIAVTLLITL